MLSQPELKDAAVLIFANKQDMPEAVSVAELSEKLQLFAIRNRPWYIQSTCATSGDGIGEGLEWLSNALIKNGKK